MTEQLPGAVPDLMTLLDVLARLKGKVGRTALLKHLKSVPEYGGGATYGRCGRKYYFTAAQYDRLIDSIAAPAPPCSRQAGEGLEDRAFARVLELTRPGPGKGKGGRSRPGQR